MQINQQNIVIKVTTKVKFQFRMKVKSQTYITKQGKVFPAGMFRFP